MLKTKTTKKTETDEKSKAVERKPIAIIYIRMSTNYQVQADSNSSEMQRSACQALCQSKGLQVKKIIEQVKSGRKYRKDLFDVIQHEMRAGDTIAIYSISRFARRQKHAHDLLDILTRKKCRLLSVTENVDTEDDGRIIGLFAWLAEMESLQTSDRVKASIKAKFERLEHFGAIPYGFRYSDGNGSPLEKDPHIYEIINMMRKWRFEDKLGFAEITRRLNTQNIPTPKKKHIGGWASSVVKTIIERNDDEILVKGKRSWYAAKRAAEGKDAYDPNTDEEHDEEDQIRIIINNEYNDDEEDDTEEEPREMKPPIEPTNEIAQLHALKPLTLLRGLVMKRKNEFGLTDDEIRELSADHLQMLLS
jgi:DNA invertase Pin-like site-specific DNA recombinase